jgi:hypothetical protein
MADRSEPGVPRVLLVGELNPYGANPYFALYHLPRGASGDRLRQILGLPTHVYARRLAKVNLCTGRWSASRARENADRLLAAGEQEVLVLLGARVRDVFGGPPFYERDRRVVRGRTRVLLALPHPSGRSIVWNDPGAAERAKAALRAAAPWLYSDAGTG